MLLLNEKLMQHTVVHKKDLDKDVWLKTFSHLHSSSTSCSQMVGQGHLAGQTKFIGRSYLSFMNGGTTLNIYFYE